MGTTASSLWFELCAATVLDMWCEKDGFVTECRQLCAALACAFHFVNDETPHCFGSDVSGVSALVSQTSERGVDASPTCFGHSFGQQFCVKNTGCCVFGQVHSPELGGCPRATTWPDE